MKQIKLILLIVAITFAACKSDKKNKNTEDSKTITNLETKDESTTVTPVKEDSSKTDKELKNIPLPKNTESTKKMWYIIGGSFKEFKNAEKLYNKLSEGGYDDSEIMNPSNKFNRVVISSFEEETKARAELARLRAARGDKSIWLLEGK